MLLRTLKEKLRISRLIIPITINIASATTRLIVNLVIVVAAPIKSQPTFGQFGVAALAATRSLQATTCTDTLATE